MIASGWCGRSGHRPEGNPWLLLLLLWMRAIRLDTVCLRRLLLESGGPCRRSTCEKRTGTARPA